MKIYNVFYRAFHGHSIYGGFFLDLSEGLATVTKHRDEYVSHIRPSASFPNMQNQARDWCKVEYTVIEPGKITVYS